MEGQPREEGEFSLNKLGLRCLLESALNYLHLELVERSGSEVSLWELSAYGCYLKSRVSCPGWCGSVVEYQPTN